MVRVRKGESLSSISRDLKVSRATLRNWKERGIPTTALLKHQVQMAPLNYLQSVKARKEYSFLLGEYLGDGYIAVSQGCPKLIIAQDSRYPMVIDYIHANLQTLFPLNKVTSLPVDNYVRVTVHTHLLLELFPQHGAGKKATRHIALTQWQQDIVNQYPWEMLQGLLWSDGYRKERVFDTRTEVHHLFSNTSRDIIQICAGVLDLLDINYTVYSKQPSGNRSRIWTVSVHRKADASQIDAHVPLKH